jgi:type IV secretory pathway VirB2 component (pilin)
MKTLLSHAATLSSKVGVCLLLSMSSALAQGMPWERPLSQIQSSLQGPTAKLIIIIAIIASGLTFALGEAGGFFRKASGVVFGAAIAAAASNFAGTLFGV